MKLRPQFQHQSYQSETFGDLLPEMQRIEMAIHASGKYENTILSDKIGRCCMKPMIFRSGETGSIRLYEARCKSRACPRCAKFRASATMHRSRILISKMDSPRFLTLTIRSSNRPLRSQLQFLKAAFVKLRRTCIWQEKVVGGIYTWEVTYNVKTQQWHPHLHAVIDGKYFHQRSLLLEWQRILNDQAGVHIRKVHSVSQASKYLASYIAKSSSIESMPDECISEWAQSISGMRLFQPFGNLHGISSKVEDDDYVPQKMYEWFSPNDLAWDAMGGDNIAARLLEELQALKPDQTNMNLALSHQLTGWRIMRKYEKPPLKRRITEPSNQLTLY